MSQSFRTQLITSSVSLAITCASVLTSQALAQASDHANRFRTDLARRWLSRVGAFGEIPASMRRPAWIDPGFTQSERALLKRAVDIVYQRFLHTKVEFNYLTQTIIDPALVRAQIRRNNGRIPRDLRPIRAAYQNKSSVWPSAFGRFTDQQHPSMLGFMQRNLMRSSLTKEILFPAIEIRAAHADEDDPKWGNAHAWAPVGSFDFDAFLKGRHCQFELTVNRYYLGARSKREYTDPNFWASTIVHEMMHNLGHRHPYPVDHPTYRLMEMNIFARCVGCNGGYCWGDSYFPVVCGCKR